MESTRTPSLWMWSGDIEVHSLTSRYEKHNRPGAEVTSASAGWQSSLGWLSDLTLILFIAATTTQGVVNLKHPSYTPEPWHATLLLWTIVLFAFFANNVVVHSLPFIELAFLLSLILGLAVIVMALATLAPMNNGHDVFLVLGVALFVEYESPAHVCTDVPPVHCVRVSTGETQNASEVVPSVITWSMHSNKCLHGARHVWHSCFGNWRPDESSRDLNFWPIHPSLLQRHSYHTKQQCNGRHRHRRGNICLHG